MRIIASNFVVMLATLAARSSARRHGLAFISSTTNTNNIRSINRRSLPSQQHRFRRRTEVFSTTETKTTTTASTTEEEEEFWSVNKVRSTWIDYFAEKEHTFQPSSACAPLNDPTLLFTNAGMNQFKPIFLGQVDPSSPLSKLKRAANSQKCIRAGGKHNDLEDVGKDTYHHTFFEMLGSWSFGDYFKKEAIDYAWELLTVVYKMDPDRLYATYFEGNEDVPADLEAKEYWMQYLPEDRVIASNAADNFWEMGDTGPCGPCTEIHFDRIGGRNAAHIVNQDDPNVLEIWNLVFIQYNRGEEGLSPLPNQHVDTGMGLERLVSVLQDKMSNYDTDAFTPLFNKIEEFSKVGPYEGKILEEDVTKKDTAYRAIADHARALTFAIADGAVPNNEGRGYVLRRILRRATRYGQQILKAEPGFFATLVPIVVDTYGEAFPELVKNQDTVLEIIQEEEKAFSTMLDRGIKFFAELEDDLKKEGKDTVSGKKAFFLYDTLGFPIDLTELMAEEAGLRLDSNEFKKEMETQKQRSRDARNASKKGGSGVLLEFIAEQTSYLSDTKSIAATDDSYKYELSVKLSSTISAIYAGKTEADDENVGFDSAAEEGDYVGVVLDKSSFYAESGGQEADTGLVSIVSEDGKTEATFVVQDVQSYGGYLLHTGVVTSGSIKVGAGVVCEVDYDRRTHVTPNHSMTHVLNSALRDVLGDNVDQRGSLCNSEKLRFDFTHKKALTLKQLKRVETICKEVVSAKLPVTSDLIPLSDAQSIDGVRAVFGEVYPDPVRVVKIGKDTSIEFCGGTHMTNTGEAEQFCLVEETAVAKGIRRITAVTRSAARRAIDEGTKLQDSVDTTDALKPESTPELGDLAATLRKELDEGYISAPLKAQLRSRIEAIQKKSVDYKKAQLAGRVDRILNDLKQTIQDAADAQKDVLVMKVGIGADAKASQKVMNTVKSIAPDMAFMGISEEEEGQDVGKVMAFALVPDSMIEKSGLVADAWIRQALERVGGRGGGKPNNAQGQAKECQNVDNIVEDATAFANEAISTMA